MKKRVTSLVVSLMMAGSLLGAVPPIKSNAYTSHTQQEALDWVRNQVGKGIDYDGVYGNQCVDLIKAYYNYLGVSPVSGNGSDYTFNPLPSGWQRIEGATPQPGDVLVYTGGYKDYGHVAIYEADRIHYHQNFNDKKYQQGDQIQCIGYMYNGLTTPYWGIIRPDFSTHTHNYSSNITQHPTCTETGVSTYTCSCGNSYTEIIAAKGHSYTVTTVSPTITDKGYILHTCSECGDTYKDAYIDPPILEENGWYYCDALPSGIMPDKHTIEYRNYYETTQQTSPGEDWANAGTIKNEWQNVGAPYTSPYDLETSDARILVDSAYYHFCGPNAGDVGNYELSGNFVHYDAINPNTVTAEYLGDDEGHPYYFLYGSDGNQVWCSSGISCDGSWGTHGNRCRAWYKENTYQDRVNVELYKFTKQSNWVKEADETANSTTCRYRAKGDINTDGSATVIDVVLLQKYLHASESFTEEQFEIADLNTDGQTDIFDLALLKRILIQS